MKCLFFEKIRIVLFLFLLVPFSGSALQRYLVNSSHNGAVRDMVFEKSRDLLFSAGEDGTVKIWNVSQKKLVANLRVSIRPIQRIVLHPKLSQLAVVEGDNLRTNSLSVWDWRKKERLFSIEIADEILSLGYSSAGKYLVYSKADFNSLVVISPRNGAVLDVLAEGFGIVAYFTISKTERNIMTYQPSGWINYWDLRTGNNLKRVKTLPDLTSLVISPDSRYIAATNGDDLLLIDVLQGTVADRVELPGIKLLRFAPNGKELAAIVESKGFRELKKFYSSGRLLFETRSRFEQDEDSFQLSWFCYGTRGLLVADQAGNIIDLRSIGRSEFIARNELLEISGLAFGTDLMVLVTKDLIAAFSSDFFSNASPGSFIEKRIITNPYSYPLGIQALGSKFLLWPNGEEVGELATLDTRDWGITPVHSGFSSPLVQCEITEAGIIIIEKSGRCWILDSEDFNPRFEYQSPGMNKLVVAADNSLIGGKSIISSFGSPLLQINQFTGETVPIPEPSLFIYDLIFDKRRGRIFSLGVGGDGETKTELKLHTGLGLDRSRILDRFDGEDLGASLVLDDAGNLYSSLGMSAVKVWNGLRLLELERSGRLPRKLFFHEGKLYALNRDSTITVWDLRTRRILFDIYVFKDLSWAALSPKGTVFRSQDAKKYLVHS
ncbi:MAG TPA: hypothetical protein ENI27_05625 [bacterium]|nr:hypothetical protein [bacterium]